MKLKNQNYYDGVYHLKNEIGKEEKKEEKPVKAEKKPRKKKGE